MGPPDKATAMQTRRSAEEAEGAIGGLVGGRAAGDGEGISEFLEFVMNER